MKRQLLIATTNEGKFKEIQYGLESLPFIECISLSDIKIKIEPPEEVETSLHANAYLKAKYYAEASGLITIADDTGLFIDALDGWPGEQSARVADSDEGRIGMVLEKMKGIKNRYAEFRLALAIYDPKNNSSYLCEAKKAGIILDAPVVNHVVSNFGYTRIFYVEEAKKTFAEMDTKRKK